MCGRRFTPPRLGVQRQGELIRVLFHKILPSDELTDQQLFADYVDIALHLDETILFVTRPPPGTPPAELTAARERLAAYKASIPRLLQLLPGVFTDKTDLQSAAALSCMLKELSRLANAFVLGDDFKRPGVSRALMDADRLHLLQVTARDSFVGNLGTCVVAV